MMSRFVQKLAALTAWITLVAGGVSLLFWPGRAPAWVLFALLTTSRPLLQARRWARGTALGSVVAWTAIAVVLGALAQWRAIGVPTSTGRPAAGAWAYLSALATLAALISAFNARRPGGGAWAILMGMLVLVFCIPWLEGSGLAHRGAGWGPPRLDAPWSGFYALLIVAGATNYLPPRYGPSAAAVACSLAVAGFARGTPAVESTMAAAAPWALALAIWLAEARSRAPTRGVTGLDRLWRWFRDHWGVVWALRVQERFNRAAEGGGWPVRLGWFGPERPGESTSSAIPPETPLATLSLLLRRFADADRIVAEAGDPPGP